MFALGLDNPKNGINLGHVLRAADAYGASLVATTGNRVKTSPDVSAAWRKIPVVRALDLRAVIPFGCVPVAVELHPRAVNLVTYTHPPNAFYIFGAEDNTLGERILGWCRDVVYVPTALCMNLSACVNVVCYDRIAKHHHP